MTNYVSLNGLRVIEGANQSRAYPESRELENILSNTEIIDEIFLFLREAVGFVFIICLINKIVYRSSTVTNYRVSGDHLCSQC